MDNRDLKDSERDRERLKQDKGSLDLPEVKDIPGQEHVHVPPPGEMADITVSSDDEEGIGVFEDDEEDETIIVMGSEADIPDDDKTALERMDHLDVNENDDEIVVRGFPDDRDTEGDQLNERIDVSGSDLDTAVDDEDDANENIGKEAGEHSAIFYRKDRFTLIKNGDFWLSETPDQPSKGWDATCCNRICSWVQLTDNATGKNFYFF